MGLRADRKQPYRCAPRMGASEAMRAEWAARGMTHDDRLGVLLLSFASLGGQAHQKAMYLPVLRAHPALRLVAVADEAAAPAEQHALNRREAEALDLAYVPDLDAALADPRVDVVSVCCPFERRLAVLERVAS